MAASVFGLVRDAVSAGQVFSEPVERGGTTLIGVARVYGGGGGDLFSSGASDGGLGFVARPVGAYVLRDGAVRWIPAVDVNRLVVAAAVLGVVVLARRARRRKKAHTHGGLPNADKEVARI
jgi:hypothetical protein